MDFWRLRAALRRRSSTRGCAFLTSSAG